MKRPDTYLSHPAFWLCVPFMKDTLFLLTSGFNDGDGAPYYCPACLIFEGLLHLYPQLESQIEVRRIAFPRPRPEVVGLLGELHQSCPVLILGKALLKPNDNHGIKTVGNHHFINDPQAIGNYLALTYGIPRPH